MFNSSCSRRVGSPLTPVEARAVASYDLSFDHLTVVLLFLCV